MLKSSTQEFDDPIVEVGERLARIGIHRRDDGSARDARDDLKPTKQPKVMESTKATEVESDRSRTSAGEGKPDISWTHWGRFNRDRLGDIFLDVVNAPWAQISPKHMGPKKGVAVWIS